MPSGSTHFHHDGFLNSFGGMDGAFGRFSPKQSTLWELAFGLHRRAALKRKLTETGEQDFYVFVRSATVSLFKCGPEIIQDKQISTAFLRVVWYSRRSCAAKLHGAFCVEADCRSMSLHPWWDEPPHHAHHCGLISGSKARNMHWRYEYVMLLAGGLLVGQPRQTHKFVLCPSLSCLLTCVKNHRKNPQVKVLIKNLMSCTKSLWPQSFFTFLPNFTPFYWKTTTWNNCDEDKCPGNKSTCIKQATLKTNRKQWIHKRKRLEVIYQERLPFHECFTKRSITPVNFDVSW